MLERAMVQMNFTAIKLIEARWKSHSGQTKCSQVRWKETCKCMQTKQEPMGWTWQNDWKQASKRCNLNALAHILIEAAPWLHLICKMSIFIEMRCVSGVFGFYYLSLSLVCDKLSANEQTNDWANETNPDHLQMQ